MSSDKNEFLQVKTWSFVSVFEVRPAQQYTSIDRLAS